jgi:UDP-glucose 4-epimerase
MTILVTGSSGHLGEALMRTLRAAGNDVVGVDRVASDFTDVVGSLVDPAVVERAMDRIDAVIHTATLHKPHVATHSRQDFVDTNITGTLNLLEAAVRGGVRAFVYTSTTSAFGDALTPPAQAPAAWIDESITPVPKNIYGVTKIAAEDLCALAHRNQKLACIILRTSRFFPEPDDLESARSAFSDSNLKANEYLNRRVDIEDVVDAHLCALRRAPTLGFGRYVVSATTPFQPEDVAALRSDLPSVLDMRVAGWRDVYAQLGWHMPQSIDRVYDNARARSALEWNPRHDFASVIRRAQTGDIRSDLARAIGSKGYHGAAFADGLYPVS